MSGYFSEPALADLASGEPVWLRGQRRAAWDRFSSLPYPTPRDDGWRRFNLRALKIENIAAAAGSQTLSDVKNDGVIFCDIATAIGEHPDLVREHLKPHTQPGKFIALHEAFWQNGVFAYVPGNLKLPEPLEVTYHLTGEAFAPRSIVIIEPGAEATFIERFAGGNGAIAFHAGGTDVFVKDSGKLHYVSLQNFSASVYDFTVKRARVERDAEIDWVFGMFGGAFSRCDADCAMHGPGGRSFLYGVGVGADRQQFGQFTRQHHLTGHTTSDLLFKNVYRDEAIGVYSGIIRVEKNANGTNAYQANRNLVLSDKVKCDTRPLLEIESNDLRCTHGATVGRLDENQIFYLRSRGLTESQSREILTEGFLQPVLARIKVPATRREFAGLIHHKLARP
jgi:Fe-S cluster assembly protein SufD